MWHKQYHNGALLFVRNRLLRCSSLRQIATEAAVNGLRRFEQMASDDSFYLDEYRTPAKISQRWINTSVYRQTLKGVLDYPVVASVLETMAFELRQVLRFCYVDQLNLFELARVANGTASRRHLSDMSETKQLAISSYQRLSELLNKNHPTPDFVPGRLVEYPWVFPEPPLLSGLLKTGIENEYVRSM